MDKLIDSRIFIFGAGVRGMELLNQLLTFDFKDIYFVDNNLNKCGKNIDSYKIISFEEANNYKKKHIFLCPTENNYSILELLASTGKKLNKDFFDLAFPLEDYLEIANEIKSQKSNYTLIIGDCASSDLVIEDGNITPALTEALKGIFKNKCETHSLVGIDITLSYYILKTTLQVKKIKPKICMLIMGIYSMSPYYPLLLRKSHYEQIKLLLENLALLIPEDRELKDYINVINNRLERSLKLNNLSSNSDIDKKRELYKLKYNYNIFENDESIVYAKKMLELLSKYQIPAILLFPPVNYKEASELCGNDFIINYNKILKKVDKYLQDYNYKKIDSSFLLGPDCFVNRQDDVNPDLNKKGQEKLIDFLNDQSVIKKMKSEN